MSQGQRIELAKADALAAFLFKRWELDPRTCFVVGSTRRRKEWVGDLELIAPLRDKANDHEYERVSATMEGFAVRSMFDAPAGPPIGRQVRGLNAGFRAACLEIDTRTAGAFPVQIYRYSPDNFGWIMLMRTGPADFGEYFLGRWKDHWGIPRHDDKHRGSVDGHLVDASGKVVPVRSEDDAFKLCGMKHVEPERRAAFVDHIKAGASR